MARTDCRRWALAVALIAGGCNGAAQVTPDPLGPTGAAINGVVRDPAGAAIEGVEISVRNDAPTATSNEAGFFQLSGVSPGKAVTLLFRKNDFAPSLRRLSLEEGEVGTTDVVLKALGPEHIVIAQEGGSFEEGPLKIVVPKNALRTGAGTPVVGPVSFRVAHLDPTTPELFAAPGDTRGTDSKGEDGALTSYGMVFVDARAGGREVDLVPGETMKVDMKLPEKLGEDAVLPPGSDVPFWIFDEESARWVEKGTGKVKPLAVDQNKLGYESAIPHTQQWWNCDKLGQMTCIRGKVVDCAGNAVPGALVRAVGLSYAGTTEASTKADGTYELFPVLKKSRVRLESRIIVGGKEYRGEIPEYTTSSGRTCGIAPNIDIPVPDLIGGVAAIQGASTVGGERLESTMVIGAFRNTPTEVGSCKVAPPVDQCVLVNPPKDSKDSVSEDLADVGPYLLLTGPSSLRVPREVKPRTHYLFNSKEHVALHPKGADLDLTVTGSKNTLDGFMVRRAVRIPALAKLRDPAQKGTGSDLGLSWDAPENPAEVMVTVTPEFPEESPETIQRPPPESPTLVCTPKDDGDFTVPVSLLSSLPKGAAQVILTRSRVRIFPTPNGMAATGTGSSSTAAELQLK